MCSPLLRCGTALLLTLWLLAALTGATEAAYPAPFGGSAPGAAPPPLAPPAAPLTHDRGGHLTWEAIGPNTAQFQASVGLRRSYYTPLPNVGDNVIYAPI